VFLAAAGASLLAAPVEAGSLVNPAWGFDRGNARILVARAEHADAGPVVVSAERQPWGWTVEYDVDIPIAGEYAIHLRYAAGEARPLDVFFDNQNVGRCCLSVTFAPSERIARPVELTWKSSGATWEGVRNKWGRLIRVKATRGRHTVKLARRGPLPHLVALRLDTSTAFDPEWLPPRFELRDVDGTPVARRRIPASSDAVDVAALRWAVEDAIDTFGPRYPQGPEHLSRLSELQRLLHPAGDTATRAKAVETLMSLWHEAMAIWSLPASAERAAGSLTIPACTFDRGNVRIFASPDEYADTGPLAGGGPKSPATGRVEYDIDVPVSGDYTLQILYSAAEARPVDVVLDDRKVGTCCHGIAFGSAPFEHPVLFTWDSSGARWEAMQRWRSPIKVPITAGKHTLKLVRSGPLPHLVTLRLDSTTAFPKDWKAPEREVTQLASVPPRERAAFLPPDAVNIGALRVAVEKTMTRYGARYPIGERELQRLASLEKEQRAARRDAPEKRDEIEASLKALRQRVMLAHPALTVDKLLFVTKPVYSPHIYEPHCANEMGGSLCVLSPVTPDGEVTDLVPELAGGLFSRFDLSFDAKRIVFGYKRKDEAFRIYEVELDPVNARTVPGSLRQLTFGGEAEMDAIRRYASLGRGIGRGFDDIDPCYLPDGRIVFASSRSMRSVFCFPATVTSLHLMEADGGGVRCVSPGPLNEMNPCVLDDGRIAYTRWEYVDKGLGNGQSLWTVRPDGSGLDHLYKNTVVRPAGMLNARSMPHSNRIVAIGAPHCGREGGPVILVDGGRTRRTPEAMTCITPEIGSPGMYQATWEMGFFQDPYPLSEELFLVSYRPGPRTNKAGYGIYVLDTEGNRAELYRAPEISCFQPIPLRPRRRPAAIPPVAASDAARHAASSSAENTGTFFVQDVYQGMTGIERGRVKYVRVMGVLPWPWSENGIFRVGLNVGVHRKKVYGVAKVHEDGSAYFAVPAEENVFFQALDENFMALQHMPTFTYLLPGEHRSCVGCHEPDNTTPKAIAQPALALNHPPATLSPQPGDSGPRMVDYAADVQPILDERCVRCHGGEEPDGNLDLAGVPTDSFNRSYENLIGKSLVSYRDCRYGQSGFRHLPPLSFGSHLSRLVAQIRKAPCGESLSSEEFIRIVTWVDANVPYYGTYRGKRGLEDKDDPDFRALPIASVAR